MYQSILSLFIDSVQPRSILRDVQMFWGFNSTVPGPGLRAASEFLARRHQENGVQAEVRSYPADDRTEWLDGYKHPLSWAPHLATLEIVEPAASKGEICSFGNEPLCLISNSTGTPPEGVCAEVVVVHNATSPEAYEGIDATGKIVFTDVWPGLAQEQARKHGVVGLITDSVTPPWLYAHPPVRAAADVPDLTMWAIFTGHRSEAPLWGFSLSPRQGAHLREIIRTSQTPVVLKAAVEADLVEGTSELTTAVLPGRELAHEEVWILSHSSEPGALDNASGCCASIEIARMLKTLVASGTLPAPSRTIRFLSGVETEGYLPYLTERLADLPDVKAALAFDAIGADFRKMGGALRLNRSPDDNPTFVDDLLETLLAAVAAEQNCRFSADNYDVFPWQVDPCFPGNDNMIADGFFDIPTPMLDCWPEKYYHSNLDTPDKLSEGSLARCTVVAAAYVYLLAAAGPEQARWMATLTLKNWKRRILDGAVLLQGIDALRSVLRLTPTIKADIQAMEDELTVFYRQEGESGIAVGVSLES